MKLLKMVEYSGKMKMNIKSKIKFYIHKGFSEFDATSMAIQDAQKVINDLDEKLSKTLNYLSVDEVKEVYGDMNDG